jgi:hypothetical protein
VTALGQRLEYEQLPKYVRMSNDEATQADAVKRFVSEQRTSLGSTAKAERAAREQFGQDAYRLYMRAKNLGKSRERQQFEKANPLLKKYWPSGISKPITPAA